MGNGQSLLSECTDLMVDIETTGLRPDRHAVIQIAAVPFQLQSQKVGDTYFDMCLKMPNARGWQETTKDWWYGKNGHVLVGIMGRGQDPKYVMESLAGFVKAMKGPVNFWCKRSFDWQFIESYFHDMEVTNPLKYQNVHEMWSYLKGASHPQPVPKVEVVVQKAGEFDAHNAYYDALWQVQCLFNTLNHLKR